MSLDLPLRARYICGRYERTLIAVFIVVSAIAFAGAAAGAAAPADTQQVTAQTDPQTINTTLTTQATVTGDTTLYESRERLTDMPVYLLSATPNVTFQATTTVPSVETTVSQQVVLELTATRNGAVFWRNQTTLASETEQVTDGQVRTSATLNVRELAGERLGEVTDATDNVGAIEARVFVDATYDTGSYTGYTNASTALSITDRAYELDTPKTDQRSHATTATKTVPVTESSVGLAGLTVPGRAVGWAAVGLVALVVALVVWLTASRIEDFEAFEKQYEKARYAEWISRGKIPDSGTYVRVPVETLLDLVDIAIDSKKRVIHDKSRDIYAVVDGNILFEFRNDADSSGWMNEFGLAPIEEMATAQEQEFTESETTVSGAGDTDPVDW
ncbi:MAG: DUF5305 family protein [Haloarculaceae archaeon]